MYNRILIIDDDDAFRSAQLRVLRKMELIPGRRVDLMDAPGGAEGLDLLNQVSVDCVMLDHDMPGGNGLYWLGRILAAAPDLAVIMLTGRGSEQLAVDAMKNGAVDYLVKGSVSSEKIQQTICNAVETKELRRTVKAQREDLIEAERQRVMIESLGAACHHIGQPATVISAYLQMMQTRETDDEMSEMIELCMDASVAINDILDRLLKISQYRSVPYLASSGADAGSVDRIIEI